MLKTTVLEQERVGNAAIFNAFDLHVAGMTAHFQLLGRRRNGALCQTEERQANY